MSWRVLFGGQNKTYCAPGFTGTGRDELHGLSHISRGYSHAVDSLEGVGGCNVTNVTALLIFTPSVSLSPFEDRDRGRTLPS